MCTAPVPILAIFLVTVVGIAVALAFHCCSRPPALNLVDHAVERDVRLLELIHARWPIAHENWLGAKAPYEEALTSGWPRHVAAKVI